jgi:ankyrin repeat protein
VLACIFGDYSYEISKVIIRYFIDIGCDLEYRNACGYTPLMYSVSRNFCNSATDYISALLDSGANVHATDHEKRGCFHISIERYFVLKWDHKPSISWINELKTLWRILMTAGCDPWTTDSSGKTAIDYIYQDDVKVEFISLVMG